MASKRPDFGKLKQRCDRFVAEHADRDVMYAALENIFLMQWEDKSADWIKTTLSPDPHNAIVGITRLMTATAPQISVARDADNPKGEDAASVQEKALNALWYRMNRARRIPVHYEAVQSAALFSEVCMQIANVAETARYKDKAGTSSDRLNQAIKDMPYTFRVYSPRTVYPEYDEFGLCSVLLRDTRRWREVRKFWGKDAAKVGLDDDEQLVTYNDYCDETHRAIWINDSEPIILAAHGLPFIPWVCTTVTGSGLFTNPKHQRQPMLYPIVEGKWWQRQNQLLTQLFTSVTLLAQPAWLLTLIEDRDIGIDLSKPGGQVKLRQGESVSPLVRQLIDPAVLTGLGITDSKMIQSTLPRVVFGESPGSTMSYSAMNLLSQGGRLPLVPIEQQVGKALADAFSIVLRWIVHYGEAVELYQVGELAKIKPTDINADHVEVEVKLKADVPQDRLQLANVVSLLTQTRDAAGLPLISGETARGFLEFMQPGDEAEQIARELFIAEHLKNYMQNRVQLQQQRQERIGAPLPTGLPPVQMGPPQVPGGGGQMGPEQMPPEMMGQEMQGGPQY